MLDQFFMQVMDMSRVASVIILVVLIVRVLLKKFPKFVSYALWAVVLFRLLCPVSIESMISFVPEFMPISYHYTLEEESISIVGAGEAAYQAIGDIVNGGFGTQHVKTTETHADGTAKIVTASGWEVWILFGQYVWLAGICVMVFYSMISYRKVRRKVSMAIPLQENIYLVDEEISPFVMGIFHPKIYLPENLDKKEQEYIILHEQFHIRRLDHVVKLLAYTALCIHWFNPLVWVAFFLSSKDMEMSCDEAVIKRMGEAIKADYSASLLALAVGQRVIIGVPLAFGEGDTRKRIINLANWKMPDKKKLSIVTICVVILMVCLVTDPIASIANDEHAGVVENEELHVSITIEEHYITSTGDPSNVYYIDENKVLWGRGENQYGQLGQGTQDDEFHDEMVKIAENVVHVDYSQKGFVIYLTEDNKLYGFGNSGCGALQQYDTFDWDRYSNIGLERYYVGNPYLLMENVTYARCGKDDIVCLTEDGSVWTWGTIYVNGGWNSAYVKFIEKPEKILENAVLVTGGWFNHAALLEDGTVWTWGYNYTGNCGVKDKVVVAEPTKVAEDVVMVWTGTMQYNIDCFDYYTPYNGEYPRHYENTLIKKSDGSYWICGADVGTEERYIPFYYETADITMICTHEFLPVER